MLSEHKSHHCQHRSDDFPAIAAILTPHRPRVVVELGTDRGGFGGWLADLVAPWGGVVSTFDIEAKFKPELLRDFPNLQFFAADVLGTGPAGPAARHPLVAALVAQPGVLLYCDNGDKKREVELYAPLLRVGSILGVHDYQTEIMAEWVEPFVAALGYEPEGHARMEALRNEWYPEPMSRFWVRRRIVEPRMVIWHGEKSESEAQAITVDVTLVQPPVAPGLPVDTSEIDAGWFHAEPAAPDSDPEPDEVPTLLTRMRRRLGGGR